MSVRSVIAATACSAVVLTVMTPSPPSFADTQPRHWVHRADMDGDGVPDRIVISADRDLRIDDGHATGHYTLRVTLSSTRRVLERRFHAVDDDGPSGNRHWSPWFGAATLDHVGGKEVVLGASSGASSQQLYVLVYTEGRLATLPAPGGGEWDDNGDADFANGYRCTAHGIETRFYDQTRASFTHWVVGRDVYVWQDDRWIHTKRSRRHVHSEDEPRGTSRFGQFRCRGLDG